MAGDNLDDLDATQHEGVPDPKEDEAAVELGNCSNETSRPFISPVSWKSFTKTVGFTGSRTERSASCRKAA
jgi:hypothetical protein